MRKLFELWNRKVADVPLWSRWLLLASVAFLGIQTAGFVENVLQLP